MLDITNCFQLLFNMLIHFSNNWMLSQCTHNDY